MRIMTVHPGPGYSVADVHLGWVKALRRVGPEFCAALDPATESTSAGAVTDFALKEYDLGNRLGVLSEALLPNKDRTYRPMFDTEGAVQLMAENAQGCAYQFWPDVVFVTSGFFVPAKVLHDFRARGITIVLLCTEQPYELVRELNLAQHSDIVLLNDPRHLDTFAAFCPQVFFQGHCFDPEIQFPGPPLAERETDLAWVGTMYNSRIEFLEKVRFPEGASVALGGNWERLEAGHWLEPYIISKDRTECIFNDETAALYRTARVSWNTYRQEAEDPNLSAGDAMSPREVELAACGTWFARESRAESDETFPMLPTFETPDELSDLLAWALSHPAEAQAQADAARAAVAERTFDNAVPRVLDAIVRHQAALAGKRKASMS